MEDDDKEKPGSRKVEPIAADCVRLKWAEAAARRPTDDQRMMDEIEREAKSLAEEGSDEDRKRLALLAFCVAYRHAAFADELLKLVTTAVEHHKSPPRDE